MEHLNYCRQMVKQFTADFHNPSADQRLLSHAIDLAAISTKFLLPDGGRLIDDLELKGLDETQPLRLPYQFIALEYNRACLGPPAPGLAQSTKAIIFAREHENAIALLQISWFDNAKRWAAMGEVTIPRTGYLDRGTVVNGRTCVKHTVPAWPCTIEDFADEVGSLMNFLNILQCSNVHVERSEPKRAGKKIKAALQFDTYHLLTIDIPSVASGDRQGPGTHRSPREHLRRGHIRRLSDGRRIWVNAAVVGGGKGAGIVTKDYAIRCAA